MYLDDLKESITKVGVLVPITVYENKNKEEKLQILNLLVKKNVNVY